MLGQRSAKRLENIRLSLPSIWLELLFDSQRIAIRWHQACLVVVGSQAK